MDRYRTLLEVNNAVINCLGQEELLEAVILVLKRVIPCDKASLAFYDRTLGEACLPARPVLFEEGLRSHATAPLVVRGESIGVLGVGSLEPGKYSDDDRKFIEEVACQVALAAANIRAYEAVHSLRTQLEAENTRYQDEIRRLRAAAADDASPGQQPAELPTDVSGRAESLSESLREIERRHIAATLLRCGWVIEGNRGAAKALGLHPNTLRHRLRKLDLRRPSKAEN
jgi:GAF domain-containing protein